jgi:hypothetical protein
MRGFADMTRVTSPPPFGPSPSKPPAASLRMNCAEGRARAKSGASGAGVSLRSTAVLDFARTERSFLSVPTDTGAAL